ncbi:MAG TPA: hypothetical protein VK146_16415 [Tabrizicola sp.]|nr:hypothetical protein [Tabrizicola sp.]
MTETTVELGSLYSTGKRVVLGLIGLAVAALPLWDLWPGIASLSLISPVFWVIGLGALAIGMTLIGASIFGPSTLLSVGPDGVSLRRESPLRRRIDWLQPEALGPILVEVHAWSEGPSNWRVTIGLKGAKPLLSQDFPDRALAEQLAERLAAALKR